MYAVIDIETSGLTPFRHEIIALACVIADDNFNTVGEFYSRIRAVEPHVWTEQAESIHRIPYGELLQAPYSSDVFDKFNQFLDRHHSAEFEFVCHARPRKSPIDLFDLNFIFAWYFIFQERVKFYSNFPYDKAISTVLSRPSEARRLYGMPNQKLSSWAERIDYPLDHHEALSDARCCLRVLEFQRERGLDVI